MSRLLFPENSQKTLRNAEQSATSRPDCIMIRGAPAPMDYLHGRNDSRAAQPMSQAWRITFFTRFRPLDHRSGLVVEQHLQLEIPNGRRHSGPLFDTGAPCGIVRCFGRFACRPYVKPARFPPLVGQQAMLAQQIRVCLPARDDGARIFQDASGGPLKVTSSTIIEATSLRPAPHPAPP